MTIAEMHTQLNLRVQKINSNAFDIFLPEERDEYINLAITRFIKNRFLPESNYIGEGFEQNQKRYDDLRSLVKKDESLSVTSVVTNAGIRGYFIDRGQLPADYMFLISVRCKVDYARNGVTFTTPSGARVIVGTEDTDYKTWITKANIVQSDDIYSLLLDPFNKTSAKEPIGDLSEDGIDIYTDDTFIVDDIIINYLKTPVTVSLATSTASDLPEHTHDEIVDMAAELMLSDIGALGTGNQIETLKKVE